MSSVQIENARNAKEEVRKILQGRTELAGIGITFNRAEDAYGIKVNLSQSSSDDDDELLKLMSKVMELSKKVGVPISFHMTGQIQGGLPRYV